MRSLRLEVLRLVNLRSLWHRRALTFLAISAVVIATSLLATVFSLRSSIDRSVEEHVRILTGDSDWQIVGPADSGLSTELLPSLDELSGVTLAVPVVEAKASTGGESVTVVGLNATVLETPGELGEELRVLWADVQGAGPGVVAGPGLGATTGQALDLSARDGNVLHTRVAQVVRAPWARALSGGRFVVVPLPVAQGLLGQDDEVTRILVYAAKGQHSALEEGLKGAVGDAGIVSSTDSEVRQLASATRTAQDASAVTAALALMLASFLVFNTFRSIGLQRRAETATVRAIGGSSRLVTAGLIVEAVVVGLPASLLGASAGLFGGRVAVDALPSFITSATGVPITFHVHWWTFPGAGAVGVVAAVAGALLATREAVRVAPIEASSGAIDVEDLTSRVRAVPLACSAGLLAGGGYLAAAAQRSEVSAASALMLAMGVVALLFATSGPIARALRIFTGWHGRVGAAASPFFGRSPRRVWAAVASVAIAVAVVTAMGGVTDNVSTSVRSLLAPVAEGDLFIETAPPNDFYTDPYMPDRWIDDLVSLRGVERVMGGQIMFAAVNGTRVMYQGVSPGTHVPTVRAATTSAQRALHTQDAAIVSEQFATRYGVSRGDTFDLPTPTGRRSVEVLDVVPSMFWPTGVVALSLDRLQSWFNRPGMSFVELDATPETRSHDLRRRVRAFVKADASFPVYDATGVEQQQAMLNAVAQLLSLLRTMQVVIAAGAVLALANVFAVSITERQRELGILRAIGVSGSFVGAAVMCEALVVGLGGALVGVVLGGGLHFTGVEALAGPTGISVRHAFTFPPYLLGFVAGPFVAVWGVALPARRAARLDVVAALAMD